MKTLIISEKPSDFSKLLDYSGTVEHLTASEAADADISNYDAYCLLGGTDDEPLILSAPLRLKLEAEAANGKRFFCEYVKSFYGMFFRTPHESTHHRLIFTADENAPIAGLATGDILDDENNTFYDILCGYDTVPLLVYHDYIIAHSHISLTKEEITADKVLGMWRRGGVIFTSFRFCNFNRARLAPRKKWESLVAYLVEYLTGKKCAQMPAPIVAYKTTVSLESDEAFNLARKNAVEKALHWLENMAVDGGYGGIREGMSHKIKPNGIQVRCNEVRTDCTGEAAGAFLLSSLVSGSTHHAELSKRMYNFIFDNMIVSGGKFDGLMRWTETEWETCYGDDVARTVLPLLYEGDLLKNPTRAKAMKRVLDFLNSTTASNGIRASRTDIGFIADTDFAEIRSNTDVKITEHHNGYYQAALALAARVYGNAEWLETAEKGMQTAMSVYPETYREQSETEEMWRMILPLAVLFDITKKDIYRNMLYRICDDLDKLKHPFGGYKEWDTGYKANRSRLSKDECSLLSENGDPVADQLYSVNWLPIGFAYAYKATGDSVFKEKWKNIVKYFIKTQMVSNDIFCDGAWTRAFDMNLQEAYGVPHDVGWAAYCVESGWTVAEIAMGMMIMELIENEK